MAQLHPTLFDEIVAFCRPHFRLPADRDAILIPVLQTWDRFYEIIWTGSPQTFTVNLVNLLPQSQLKQVLHALPIGVQASQEIDRLCAGIDRDAQLYYDQPDPSDPIIWTDDLIGVFTAVLAGRANVTVLSAMLRRFDLQRRLAGGLATLEQDRFDAVVAQLIATSVRDGWATDLVHAAHVELTEDRQLTELTQLVTARESTTTAPLRRYYRALITELSGTRWQLDRRFVQLTLLLDRGVEEPGARFVADQRHDKFDDLRKLLGTIDESAIVLLGKPGSGKTTLIKRLQLEWAWDALAMDAAALAEHPIAFFVPLNRYDGSDPAAWLAAQWAAQQPTLPPFSTLFDAGRFLLLLDGLNEMPHRDKADYRAQIGRWQTFLAATQAVDNTIVFSCRSLDFSAPLSSESVTVRQVDVEPLTPGQIEVYLNLHLGQRGNAVWAELQQDDKQVELFSAPFFLRLLADEVAATGDIPKGQAALLTGFVRRTLRREIERQQRLFEPGNLLTEDDVLRINQNLWLTPTCLPDEGLLIPHLEQLAYRMQDGRQTGASGQVRIRAQAARDLLDHARAQEIIDAGIQINVLDKDLARQEVTFFHQLIQEYFAGRVLARMPEPQRAATPWRADDLARLQAEELAALPAAAELPALPATGWEETLVLAAAMMPVDDQARFVADLMPLNLPLAARCAAAPEVTGADALKARIQDALLARIGDDQADVRTRIAAAEALGAIGDPRFERRSGLHGDYLLPPTRPIAGGSYVIGADDSQYADEKPAHAVAIVAFEMGVYPVTNAEYRLFVDANGYEDERWWQTDAARAWLRGETSTTAAQQQVREMQAYYQGFSEETIRNQRVSPEQIETWLWIRNSPLADVERQYEQWYATGEVAQAPAYWQDSRFNHPTQPVVGVSWFEANAYCAWLSAQTGHSYTLPTEAEWEAAAKGALLEADTAAPSRWRRKRRQLPQGRTFAYGNDFDPAKCNTYETRLRRTTPVGVFPAGFTPEGIADLSGNVYEWTTTLWGQTMQQPDFPYPYDSTDGREDVQDGLGRRILRGGSWSAISNYARVPFRDRNLPHNRRFNDGFRCLVRRPPSHLDP